MKIYQNTSFFCVVILHRLSLKPNQNFRKRLKLAQTWNSGDSKSPSPAHAKEIGVHDEIADDVGETEAEVDAELEEGQGSPAGRGSRQVGDHRRGKRDAPSLKDAEEETKNHQLKT